LVVGLGAEYRLQNLLQGLRVSHSLEDRLEVHLTLVLLGKSAQPRVGLRRTTAYLISVSLNARR
jgi:hypothetical protein